MSVLHYLPVQYPATQILDDSRAIMDYLQAQGKDASADEIRKACGLTGKRWDQARMALMDERMMGYNQTDKLFCIVRKTK